MLLASSAAPYGKTGTPFLRCRHKFVVFLRCVGVAKALPRQEARSTGSALIIPSARRLKLPACKTPFVNCSGTLACLYERLYGVTRRQTYPADVDFQGARSVLSVHLGFKSNCIGSCQRGRRTSHADISAKHLFNGLRCAGPMPCQAWTDS